MGADPSHPPLCGQAEQLNMDDPDETTRYCDALFASLAEKRVHTLAEQLVVSNALMVRLEANARRTWRWRLRRIIGRLVKRLTTISEAK